MAKIKQLRLVPDKEYQQSVLEVELSGKDVNCCLVNSFRRAALDYVPTYAFSAESVDITKNTSVYNNDQIKERLSQFCFPNINHSIEYLDDIYWRDIDFLHPERTKHPDDNDMYEMYVNVLNETKEVINVTTDDAEFFVSGEKKDIMKGKKSQLILKLRPGAEFNCRCIAHLGVGKKSGIYSSVANAYYEEINQNTYNLTFKSIGQLHEYVLMKNVCTILINKLNSIKDVVNKQFQSIGKVETETVDLKLQFEDTTVGHLINEYLQDHADIVFCAVSRPDLNVEEVIIKYIATKDYQKPVIQTIDNIMGIIKDLQKSIEKLGKNFI